jgi:Ca-activated chloride channel homolog
LVDEYPRARFAVIAFAAGASIDWPLSDDAWSLKSFVKGLSPYTLVTANALFQVNATAARDLLRDKLDEASKTYYASKSLVFYLGEGAAGSRVPPVPFEGLKAKAAGGAVLGYGTPEGGPVPQGWLDGAMAYQTDPGGGGPLNSSIDQHRLKDIAAEINVPYFHRESGEQISGVIPAFDRGPSIQGEGNQLRTEMIERQDLYWLFTLLSATLLLAELAATIREYRRNRLSRRDVEQ